MLGGSDTTSNSLSDMPGRVSAAAAAAAAASKGGVATSVLGIRRSNARSSARAPPSTGAGVVVFLPSTSSTS